MNLVEKVFALRAVAPFSELRPEELLIVADAMAERELPPGRVLVHRGASLHHLFVRVAGDLINETGETVHPIVGTTVLFTGCEAPYTVLAGPAGYRGLALPRSRLLTIVNECPQLLVGFFRMPIVVPRERAGQRVAP